MEKKTREELRQLPMEERWKYLFKQKGDWKDWTIFILLVGGIIMAFLYYRDITALKNWCFDNCLCPGITTIVNNTQLSLPMM